MHDTTFLQGRTGHSMLLAESCGAGGLPRGPYFGQSPPESTAVVFAPGIVSLADRYEYSVAFSPDLSEFVFGVTDSLWATFTLLYSTMSADGAWSDPVTAPFLGEIA